MPLLGPEAKEQMTVAGRVGSIGIELGLSIALGFFAGRWLDGVLGTTPWLALVGLGLGLAAGGRSLYRLVKKTRTDLDTPD
jgi:F0F1-type ATP synthase assembly protein I